MSSTACSCLGRFEERPAGSGVRLRVWTVVVVDPMCRRHGHPPSLEEGKGSE